MVANKKFRRMPKSFWASVRTIGHFVGYTDRKTKLIKVPSIDDIRRCFTELGLNTSILVTDDQQITKTADELRQYFEYRANVLNKNVKLRLMTLKEAGSVLRTKRRLHSTCPLPFNKQKGDKKAFAYFTGIINMLIEASSGESECNFDPRELTTITADGVPVRTLARRVDGAFPQAINPIAIWEIKEYYYTNTFGSREADGVYETLLDGMKLEELYVAENIEVLHYLMIDDHFTWWECRRSYLCRIIDMLNMGYVDEVLFGREVLERLPEIVKHWTYLLKGKGSSKAA